MRLKSLPLSVRQVEPPRRGPVADRRWRNWIATIPILLLGPALLVPYLSTGAAGATLTQSGMPAPGATIQLSGGGFPVNQRIQIRWDGSVDGMPIVLASGTGGLTTTVGVPSSARPGTTHRISASRFIDPNTNPGRGRRARQADVLADVPIVIQRPAATDRDLSTRTVTPPTASTSGGASPSPSSLSDTTLQGFAALDGEDLETTPSPDPTPTPSPVRTPAPTRKPTPPPTPRPTAPPAPGVTGVYGTMIGADTLANTQIVGATRVAYRFRADRSSSLTAVRVYFEIGSGYSGGSGGTRRVTIETDSAGHPSGHALATASVSGLQQFTTIPFAPGAALTAGQTYHVVFTNTDSSPSANFVSANALLAWDRPSPVQATLGSGWAVLYAPDGGSWAVRGGYTPILEVRYSSGSDGVGYMEAWVGSQKAIGGSAAVRETFKPSGSNRTISSATVRLQRASGSGALSVAIEDSAGRTIASGSVAASAFPTGSQCDCSSNRSGWGTASLGSVTLAAGQTYRLVLRAPAGTTYRAQPLRQGSGYGFNAATFFGEGQMEYTSGGSWQGVPSPWGGNASEGDLQFYLK